MGTVVSISAITVFVYFTLAFRIHPDAALLAAGHSFWVDLLFTGVIAAFAGITGSLTAMMISAVTGLFISLSLFGMKWYYGSAKFVRKINPKTGKKTWKFGVEHYAPTKELPKFVVLIKNFFAKKPSVSMPMNMATA